MLLNLFILRTVLFVEPAEAPSDRAQAGANVESLPHSESLPSSWSFRPSLGHGANPSNGDRNSSSETPVLEGDDDEVLFQLQLASLETTCWRIDSEEIRALHCCREGGYVTAATRAVMEETAEATTAALADAAAMAETAL